MDLAIRFPVQGRIHLESRFLFADPGKRNRRRFVERVFQVPEITQVTTRSAVDSDEVPRAEFVFCPRTYTPQQVIDRIKDSLNPSKAAAPGHYHAAGSNGYAHAQTNGHAGRNGTPTLARPNEPELIGVSITSVTPVGDAKGGIRYFRNGNIVTHWDVKHELPGRLWLKTMVMVSVDRRLGGGLELHAAIWPKVRQIVQGQYSRALGDGVLPLRKIAQIEAEKRHQHELRQAYALEREAL